MKKIAALIIFCMVALTGIANAASNHGWEQWIPKNAELYTAGKINKEGVLFWSAERDSRYILHSIDLKSGIVESYDIPGYLVQSDKGEAGILYAVEGTQNTILYQLLPDGSTNEILSIQNVEGVKTATYLNCSILAYHKGCLFYSAQFIDDDNMINYKLIRTDHQGNQYIYQLQDHVYCISADGLLAKADEEENCILIENPLDGSVQALCIPGLTIIRCLAWYDSETLLFMFKEEGELILGMLNKNSGAYGKVMTSNEKEIKLGGSFHGMMDIDAESNLLALIYPSGDESEYYAFPMLLDLDTGKRFILSYPMEYGNAKSEVISRGNRVVFQN